MEGGSVARCNEGSVCSIRCFRRDSPFFQNLHTDIPPEHHDSCLRICARGLSERGPVDNAERPGTEHSVALVHHFPDSATSMEVPDGG